MKNPIVLLVASIGVILIAVTGCQPVTAVISPLPSKVLPSETSLPVTETIVAATKIPHATLTPTIPAQTITPTVIQETQFATNLIHCGEPFCQVKWGGILNRPIAGTFRNIIDPTYPYASTRNNTLEIHHGVEFVNSSGTPVLAANDGEVVYAGTDSDLLMGPYNNFYGNVVILKHPALFQDEDVFTLYAHLSAINVGLGDQVSSGEMIGKVGASGSAVGSHLHFEVRVGQNDYNHTVNPVIWFSPLAPSEQGHDAILTGNIADPEGNPLQGIPLSLERLDSDGNVVGTIYAQTYMNDGINGYPGLDENFAIPDISPGFYRFAFVYGTLHQIVFTLEPGDLGFLNVHLDQ